MDIFPLNTEKNAEQKNETLIAGTDEMHKFSVVRKVLTERIRVRKILKKYLVLRSQGKSQS